MSESTASSAQEKTPVGEVLASAWIGAYTFDEAVPPDEFMIYEVAVCNAAGDAYVTVDGYMTEIRLKAKAEQRNGKLSIYFDSYGKDDILKKGYETGDRLLTIARTGDKYPVQWGLLKSQLNQATPLSAMKTNKDCSATLPPEKWREATDSGSSKAIGPAKGWLVIEGGGVLTNEVKERFVALAGGPDANFVMIPTALRDTQIDLDSSRLSFSNGFHVKHVTVLHTRDRARANAEGFVESLRHASGVWIDGGRQWRLADAYLGTAVEREIKALLVRGGVVGGGSAGATIQGSFLVRGAPGTSRNPDGDNTIMMAPGHETGFGLLANSAIDQHVDARGRENDLHPVISKHPNLLGIGIDQSAAIIVHGDSFFVVGGQVVIHDGKKHDGAPHYFLSSGQAFNLKTRSVNPSGESNDNEYTSTLTVTAATRSRTQSGVKTAGAGLLEPKSSSTQESRRINFECNVSLYSVGENIYPARLDGPHQFTIKAREVDTDKLQEFVCKY